MSKLTACQRENPQHRPERCAVEGAVINAVARTDAFYDSWPADTDAPDVDFQILGAVRERPSPIVVAPRLETTGLFEPNRRRRP